MPEAFQVNCLNEAEFRRVQEFLDAIRQPCAVETSADSTLLTPAFEAEFRSRLLTQHAFQKSPLYQESFDAAFIAAARVAGMTVVGAPDGQRFWDIELNGKKISLKSTKAKSLSESKLHISKLTEGAWIQDCRTANTRREKTFELFEDYFSQVNSIIQLRYFIFKKKYELVEIPVALFHPILNVPLQHFKADGPTINIPIGQNPPDFTLKLDRSDSKVTLANIAKNLCTVHATWKL